MQHRISLFAMYATSILLLARSAVDKGQWEAIFLQLPGGREGIPGYTITVLSVLWWLRRWWPLCLALGAAAAFGIPAALRRTPEGERLLAAGARWMSAYQGTVIVLFVAIQFSAYAAVAHALSLPWIKIIEALTSGR